MSTKRIPLHTDMSGDFTFEGQFRGVVSGFVLELGTLETPDVTVTDGVYDTALISPTGVASDTVYQTSDLDASAPTVVAGTLKVVVAGGGAEKRGYLTAFYE